MDVSEVPAELVAFVFRILGLSLLIAVFVTAVTMFVVDRMMLSPLLKLRERIARAGSDNEHPLRYSRRSRDATSSVKLRMHSTECSSRTPRILLASIS